MFKAIYNSSLQGVLSECAQLQDDVIARWFDNNLKKPARFTASEPPHYREKNRAISWFKDTVHGILIECGLWFRSCRITGRRFLAEKPIVLVRCVTRMNTKMWLSRLVEKINDAFYS